MKQALVLIVLAAVVGSTSGAYEFGPVRHGQPHAWAADLVGDGEFAGHFVVAEFAYGWDVKLIYAGSLAEIEDLTGDPDVVSAVTSLLGLAEPPQHVLFLSFADTNLLMPEGPVATFESDFAHLYLIDGANVIDDVYLIPEPGTLALFALGAALICRRRARMMGLC
jgi:hypothetical protein